MAWLTFIIGFAKARRVHPQNGHPPRLNSPNPKLYLSGKEIMTHTFFFSHFEKRPDPSDKENWQAEDIRGFVGASMPPGEKIDTTGITPLCLFPIILQITLGGKTVVVHQGSALFPTSHVWIQAVLEKKEHEEEVAKAVSDARSKVNARRILCPTGPNSPVVGKFSLTQP